MPTGCSCSWCGVLVRAAAAARQVPDQSGRALPPPHPLPLQELALLLPVTLVLGTDLTRVVTRSTGEPTAMRPPLTDWTILKLLVALPAGQVHNHSLPKGPSRS